MGLDLSPASRDGHGLRAGSAALDLRQWEATRFGPWAVDGAEAEGRPIEEERNAALTCLCRRLVGVEAEVVGGTVIVDRSTHVERRSYGVRAAGVDIEGRPECLRAGAPERGESERDRGRHQSGAENDECESRA